MKTKSFLSKILVATASVCLLVAVSSGSAYATSHLPPGYTLPGISTSGYANLENKVKLKVLKDGQTGYKVKVRKKGKDNYFNISPDERLKIKNGKYKLNAFFDSNGNFLEGTLEIKGKIKTSEGKIKGTLMTATLSSFAFSSSLVGFNTTDIFCNPGIEAIINECSPNESVYIDLENSGFDPTQKGFKSKGVSVATLPVPAAVWLFGSGLLGLVMLARRRKH